MKNTIPNILTIAGSDPSGGAGIQGDLKTFAALDCYGMAVITALTAQNTLGVRSVIDVPARFVGDQISAIFEDIEVTAVKIGMLANAEIIEDVADSLEKFAPKNIVLDPVMLSSSGASLLDSDAVGVMKERLIPLCTVLTPNIPEAEKLSRRSVIDMEVAAQGLLELGCRAAYLKGGHLKSEIARDVLVYGGGVEMFEAPMIDTQNTHGTGCTLSSAIAAYLGLGYDLPEACGRAKTFLSAALSHADQLNVGHGNGALNHGYKDE